MNGKEKGRKAERPRRAERPAPLVQVMPDMRARLDPSAVPDIGAWLFAKRAGWERLSRGTLSGTTGLVRDMRRGRIAHAKMMLCAYEEVIRTLLDTVDLRDLDRAREEWRAGLGGTTDGPFTC